MVKPPCAVRPSRCHPIPALLLRAVHGRVGVLKQILYAIAVIRIECYSDARCYENLTTSYHKPIGQIPLNTGSHLASILNKAGPLPAKPADNGETIRKGQIYVDGTAHDEEVVLEAALEAGAEDFSRDEDQFTVTTDPAQVHAVKTALEERGIQPREAEITFIPTSTVHVDGKDAELRFFPLGAHGAAYNQQSFITMLKVYANTLCEHVKANCTPANLNEGKQPVF